VVINTQKGCFKYKWLPFGVASAPALFQRTLENLLKGISNVSVYLDDILIMESHEKPTCRTRRLFYHARRIQACISNVASATLSRKVWNISDMSFWRRGCSHLQRK